MTVSIPEQSMWTSIEELAAKSDQIFVKKLSRNDTSWADDSGKHQAGFYIPREVRESGFFPVLAASNSAKPHIFHAVCNSLWPQTGESKRSEMRHYSNKGPETHFTRVPHDLFSGLSPASLLVAGRLFEPIDVCTHWFIILDSTSEEAEILETVLDLRSDFHFGLFEAKQIIAARQLAQDAQAALIDQLHHAIRTGSLERFIQENAKIPATEEIAHEARERFLAQTGFASLNPFLLEKPGDAIMQISRDIEYDIFKRHELRRRSAEIVKALLSDGDIVRAVVHGFPALNAIFLSASQQRKTRAGRSFENHLAGMLRAGSVRYEEQAVLGGRRPDFVLPDARTLAERNRRSYNDALLLSAKTTLRERWKQITHERFNCAIFLATVDDRVSKPALDDMQELGIGLVVPEALKSSKETCYPNHSGVISFREFFDAQIGRERPFLIRPVPASIPDQALLI